MTGVIYLHVSNRVSAFFFFLRRWQFPKIRLVLHTFVKRISLASLSFSLAEREGNETRWRGDKKDTFSVRLANKNGVFFGGRSCIRNLITERN